MTDLQTTMGAPAATDALDAVLSLGALAPVLDVLASRHGQVEALAAPGRIPLRFADMPAALAAIKAALNRRGIGRGDVVVIAAGSGADAALWCVATADAAIAVPLNPAYAAEEYARYLGRIRPRAVIVPADQPSQIRAAAAARAIPVFELVIDPARPIGDFVLTPDIEAACRDTSRNGGDDVAMLGHTSGTTAQQKLIAHRMRHLLLSARDMRRSFRLAPGDRSLHVMPLFHGHGMRAALLNPLVAGSTIVCVPGFASAEFFTQLRDHAITWYSASYAIHKTVLDLLRDDPTAAAGVHLRFIRSGSGKLPLDVMFGLEAALGTVVIERYGQTETGNVAVNPLPPGRRKPGTVGLAEGYEIVIRSPEDFSPLAAGEEGEVTVRGPTLCDGYLDDPAATQAAFRDGWFRTGDLGRVDDEGYLSITGRLKEMINRGGEKVSPSEIEAALARHPAVHSACAFAIPHPRLGEDVAAAVVLREGAAVDEDDLIAFAAASLADFKIPRRIHQVASLAMGATHKVDRRAIARQFLAAESATAGDGEAADATATGIRRRLEPLWRSVLKRDAVPPGRDFFLLGGDSLSAAQLVTAVEREFGIALPLRSIFREARSLARMATVIAAHSMAGPAPPPRSGAEPRAMAPRPASADVPLSFAQEQIWAHDRLIVGSPAYTISRVVRIRGPLDVAALSRAFTFLVQRHESLRTTIGERDGVPHQVVGAPFAVPVEVVDLSGLEASVRDAALERVVAEEAARAFDLAIGPLLRARAWRTAPDDHLLVVALHHVVSDGGSMRTFARELGLAYRHFVEGEPPLPAPSRIQFADFAVWDRAADDPDRLRSQLAFWRTELAGAVDVELPTDGPRPHRLTGDGDRRIRALERVDLARLRALARAEGGSLFGVLIAAIHVFLHRLTGATDIVVGAPISRRSGGDLDGVIGLLLNVLPIRQDLGGDPSFRTLLRRTTARVLGVIENRDAPLTRILEEAGVRRSADRHPLFQTVVGLASRDTFELDLPGLATEMIAADDGTSKFDLQMTFVESGDELSLRFHYDSSLFDPRTADRFIDVIERLLESIATTPDLRISMLAAVPEAQRHLLLEAWSGAGTLRPVAGTVAALFSEQARARPDATAIACGETRIAYRALEDWSTRLAHRLRAQGVGDGHIVALAAGRTPVLIAAQLAILKAGAAYLPLDAQLPAARAALIVADAGADLVLAVDEALPALVDSRARVLRLDPLGADLAAEPCTPIASGTGPRSLAYVMYTSGSTGAPKGVAVEQRGVIRLVRDADYARFGPEERVLQLGSIAFDAATFEIWGALLNGGCVVQVATPQPTLREIARIIVDAKVTTAWFTAGLFNELVDHVLDDLAGVGQVLTGGDVVSVAHVRRFRAAHPGCRLLNGYGPTETTTFATTHATGQLRAEDVAIPIGRPIANTCVYVLDAQQSLLPVGAVGELCIGGAGVARGYLGRPDLTAARFVPNPFVPGDVLYRSGDLVRWRADGVLQFLGRVDRQVKLRGFRIEPGEIEVAVCTHRAIRRAAVALRRDARGEARLALYAVAEAGVPAPSAGELADFLRERLPGYMVPAAIVLLPELPLTTQGKVDLDALPAVEFTGAGAHARVAPRDELEARLETIWREVLGVPEIGVDDDFFDLGGHSLIAAKLLARIDPLVDRPLPLATIFDAPTIALFADVIRKAASPERWPTAVPVQRRGGLPPLFAVPGVGGNVVCFATLARRLGEARPLVGMQARGLDGHEAPFDRVEDIAAHYVEQMRAIQPRGPYRILGVCIGGVFAYEMAQQLKRAGEQVALLAMLDPAFHHVRAASAPLRRTGYRIRRALGVAAFSAGRLRLYARDIARLPVSQWGGFLRRKVAVVRRAAAPRRLPNDVRREMAQQQVIAAHRAALEAYRPRPIAGDFVVFRSDDWENRKGRMSIDWRGITGRDVEFERVPGKDAGQALYDPNAPELVRRLQDHLRRIDGEPG
ncbi:MAG: amino acid adenylation domain-containing protein [Alphaproteobacteria bacterium]|nr:amino acid adenylation domain-containing protein [Alphaproteobacteria bacterium]